MRRNRLRRMVEFEEGKVIAARYDLGPASVRVLNKPTVVCRALGTTVIPMSAHERTGGATKVIDTPHRPSPRASQPNEMEIPMITSSTWIRIFNEAPDSSVRLVCCPHAGGSAGAFTALAEALPPSVEALSIQYPGRMDRRKEPGVEDLGLLAKDICAALLLLADRPLAVFGHSMGAAVAFELTRCLEDAGFSPVRLVISGRRSPSRGSGIGPIGDADIVADLKSLGGTGAKLLDRPWTRELILSVVRKDYRANTVYSCSPRTTVGCPITFLLTDNDPYVDEREALAWQDHTKAELRMTSLPGGHFYLNHQVRRVVRELLQDLL